MGYIPPKNIYDAKIGDRNIRVDIYDLPYGEFDAENPLIILGSVSLADQSRTTDLTNVQIIGDLDISKQKILINFPSRVKGSFICRSNPQMRDIATRKKVDVFHDSFVFPDGITEIDCSHSISNLSVLSGKIPFSVKQIIVADAILSKLSEDDELLIAATDFQQQYPNIIIRGEKKRQILSDVLAGQPVPTKKADRTLESITVIDKMLAFKESNNEPEYAVKTEDFCDETEIFELLIADKDIKSSKILHSTLRRKIKQLLEKFDTEIMKDEKTGKFAVCIKKTDLSKFIESLKENLQKKSQTKSEKGSKTMDNDIQTPEYSNKYEILEKCLANASIVKISGGDEELLKVKIRKYMNACSDRRLLVDPNSNRSISCIPTEKVDTLVEKVLEELKEIYRKKKPVRRTAKAEKTAVATTQPQKPVQVAKTVAPQKPILKPVLIRKYIPQQIWKEICKACGKGNTDKQMFVLKTIASVNVNVVDTPQIDGLTIINPETHVQTMSSYMKHENGQSLVQSIDSAWVSDNKRIIWTYLPEEKVLVCTGCCPEHNANKRENNKYSRIRDLAAIGQNANGEKITLQKIKNEGYLNISVLFEQLLSKTQPETGNESTSAGIKSETGAKQTEEKTVATRTGKRQRITIKKAEKVNYTPRTKHNAKPAMLQDIEVIKTTVKTIQEPSEKSGIAPILAEEPKPIALSTEAIKEAEQYIDKALGIQTPQNMVDVYAIQTYLQTFVKTIDTIVKEGLQNVSEGTDTAEQLKQMDSIRKALVQKAKIENMMPEFDKTCMLLDMIKSNTNQHTK